MGAKSVTAGFMSAVLACTGGAIMIVQAAQAAGLAKTELVSWFTSAYVIGGLLNLLLTLKYRIPFAGAHSITATAFLGTTAVGFSFPQLAGAFILSGVLILLAGLSGFFAKAIDVIPKLLIDALLAGVLLTYIVRMIPAAVQLPCAGLLAAAGYFILPIFIKRLPPLIGAIGLGLIGLLLQMRLPELPQAQFLSPIIVIPEFTLQGLLSIAIPMSLLILSNDLAVALAALRSNQFKPPVNKTLMASGLASMGTGLFGGNAANVGGLMSALCSSAEAGPHQRRYLAAVISSVIVIGFGLFSWRVIDMLDILPASFVALLTGYSLLGLFLRALKSAFADKQLLIPALITFGIAALHLSMLGIATPVWALLGGMVLLKLKKKRAAKSYM
ncbi:benzoate transporter [Paenibacillus pinisoli]|uniref:Benzoate transporter n=1 Tax=Paenibacillus pinisoli TaxID=1276110 RepID=A0A3A6PLB2_9BACL|nr:benzoate/H(+) symporter BenE family transporter [Paenibacillus pinisoli]RJX40516.1 benzoate transporter [Paenibacillus pinisoli]